MKKSLPQTGKDFHLSDIIENAVLLLAVDSEQRRIGKGDFVQAIALENEVMLIADALLRPFGSVSILTSKSPNSVLKP